MRASSLLRRGQFLSLISALEYVTPLIRITLLSRFLELRELGFCSALLASYGLLEQITDMAFYRFVMTQSREEYAESLACVHSLAILRGIFVGALAIVVAPLIASVFGLSANSGSFMFLGAVTFVRAFENFAPRVAERDFHFSAQLKVGLIANAASVTTLIVLVPALHDHRALLSSLFMFSLAYALASHYFSEQPYRIAFRSKLFGKAFLFGFPLTINGLGMALSGQADRFLVGSMLGLPVLGVYTLVSTAVILPTQMVARITGGVNTALFYKAIDSGEDRSRYIVLAGNVSAIVGALYAVTVALMLNIAVSAIFGARFVISPEAAVILAFASYFRIARNEPFVSFLLLERRTKRLALINLSVALGLIFAAALIFYFRNIESALAARLLGETFGLASAIYLTRNLLSGSLSQLSVSYLAGFAVAASAGFVTYSQWAQGSWAKSLGVMVIYAVIVAFWAALAIGPFLRGRLSNSPARST